MTGLGRQRRGGDRHLGRPLAASGGSSAGVRTALLARIAALLVPVLVSLSACGGSDLVFPGDFPLPTVGPAATATPEADEE